MSKRELPSYDDKRDALTSLWGFGVEDAITILMRLDKLASALKEMKEADAKVAELFKFETVFVEDKLEDVLIIMNKEIENGK